MANRIVLKKSSVAAKVPLVGDLEYGELALNYTDEKLYFKNASNAIKSFNVTQATLTIGTGLSGTSYNGTSGVTVAIDSTVATLSGTQTLTNKTIAAGSNTISGLTNSNLSGSAGITNANLANSSLTIGSTSISLGATATTLAGLTSVTSTTFVGALTGNASTATTLQTTRAINGVNFNGSAAITVPLNTTNRTTDETGHMIFTGTTATGNVPAYTNSGVRVNPSQGRVEANGVSAAAGLIEHANNITVTYTMKTGNNAISAGPVTIDTGGSITIPDGSTWIIVSPT